MQRKREQRAIGGALNLNRFSRKVEKFVAKCGLVVAPLAGVLYLIRPYFPEAQQLTTACAYTGAFMLVLAALCLLAKPAEATATGVKRVAGCAVRFAKNRGIGVKTARKNISANKRGTSTRTRARSRAFRSHRSRASTSRSPDEGSGDSDSSGEPPAPYPNATSRLFQPHSVRKPHIAPSPRSIVSRPDCWRLASRKMRRCF